MAIRVTERKKAVAWAVWPLGNDQSVGVETRCTSESGLGLRKINLAVWTAIAVIEKPTTSKRISRDFPAQSKKHVRMRVEGMRK